MTRKITVSKFGGSSLSNEQAMERSVRIAQAHHAAIVVVSATYGTTDRLVELTKNAISGSWEACEHSLFGIRETHFAICKRMEAGEELRESLDQLLDELETLVRDIYLLKECSPKAEDRILSIGERMSSLMFAEVYRKLFPALEVIHFDVTDIMITDDHHSRAHPDVERIGALAASQLQVTNNRVYITQGFIGRTESGTITTLGRGGSDYSASLIAEAVDADVLEIWSDVAGIATTDPRICRAASPIHEISYEEASEMAQYGAKILHPTTLVPAMRKNIPVFVGSSFEEQAEGTWIRDKVEEKPLIRAITNRDDQVLLTIRTPEMLNAVGFMDDIFGVFARHNVSVDCVTTSEISVAITMDRRMMEHEALISDLEQLGDVQFEKGKALISLIGNGILSTHGLGKNLFNALGEINVRMVSLGASAHNFNLLVNQEDCVVAVRRLHAQFIEKTRHEHRVVRQG